MIHRLTFWFILTECLKDGRTSFTPLTLSPLSQHLNVYIFTMFVTRGIVIIGKQFTKL